MSEKATASQSEIVCVGGRRRPRRGASRVETLDPSRPRLQATARLASLRQIPHVLAQALSEELTLAFQEPIPVEAERPDFPVWSDVVEASPDAWVEPLSAADGARAAILFDPGLRDSLVEAFLGGPLAPRGEGESAGARGEGEGPTEENEKAGERDDAPQGDESAVETDASAREEPEAEADGAEDRPPAFGEVSRAAMYPIVERTARALSGHLRVGVSPLLYDAGTARLGPDKALRRNDAVVRFRLKASGAGVHGVLDVCVPLQALSVPGEKEPKETALPLDRRSGPVRMVRGLDVDVTVTLGRARVRLEDIARLAPGDVLVLEQRVGRPLPACADGRLLFRALPGRAGGRFAARVVEVPDGRSER